MNIKEMVQSAKSLLNEMNEAVEAGDLDLFATKKADYDALKLKIDAKKELNDANADLDSIDVPEVTPIRPPFETDDEPEPETDKETLSNSVHIMKFGEMKAAEKAVLKDLYGNDYQQKRYDQMKAFVTYLRKGQRALSGTDEALLNQVIVRPQTLREEINKGVDLREIKVNLQEGVADLGGYTVPEDFRADLIGRLMGLTVVRGRARQVTTIRDAVEWPKLEGGDSRYTSAVRVTWVDEIPASATGAQTNMTFGLYRVPVFTVMARTDLSRNLIEDSAFNMLQVVSQLFAEAMAVDEDEKFLVGDGGGVPRGILGNRSGAEQTPETGIDGVNSGAAAALTADGLIDLVYGLDTQYRQKAVAIGKRLTHRDIRKLKDGIGDYLWEKGIAAGEPPTLLSYPFLESEALPTIAANAYPVIFGDLGGYMIVDRVGMTIERVEDTTTKGTNTVALFARRRLGGQVVEPWRFQVQKVSA